MMRALRLTPSLPGYVTSLKTTAADMVTDEDFARNEKVEKDFRVSRHVNKKNTELGKTRG